MALTKKEKAESKAKAEVFWKNYHEAEAKMTDEERAERNARVKEMSDFIDSIPRDKNKATIVDLFGVMKK